MTHQLTEAQIRRAEDAHQDQLAEQSYTEFLALTPAERAALPMLDWGEPIPVCSACSKPDNSAGDVGSAGLCATCATAAIGLNASRAHYRDDVSEAYDLGYARGFINAPRAEHDECYDSAGWLLGWEDGMADWDGQR